MNSTYLFSSDTLTNDFGVLINEDCWLVPGLIGKTSGLSTQKSLGSEGNGTGFCSKQY